MTYNTIQNRDHLLRPYVIGTQNLMTTIVVKMAVVVVTLEAFVNVILVAPLVWI